MDDCVIYDWVSITSKIHSPQDFIVLLGLDVDGVIWEQVKGSHGYQDRLYWGSISIHYNGRDDMGIWLEMSGQGCRNFESYGNGDYAALFDEVFSNPGEMNLTRLDVAFDDHSGLLDIGQICDDSREGEYVTRFRGTQRDCTVTYGTDGDSVTFGSRSSDILIRIYDKAAERGYTDGRHWVRVELQLRRERALAFLTNNLDLGMRFRGVLHNYLRFVDDPGDDINRWRWPMKKYWLNLLDGVGKITIFQMPGAEYNLYNLENFLFTQTAGAAFTYMQLKGPDDFIKRIRKSVYRLNPKYQALLDQYALSCYNGAGEEVREQTQK